MDEMFEMHIKFFSHFWQLSEISMVYSICQSCQFQKRVFMKALRRLFFHDEVFFGGFQMHWLDSWFLTCMNITPLNCKNFQFQHNTFFYQNRMVIKKSTYPIFMGHFLWKLNTQSSLTTTPHCPVPLRLQWGPRREPPGRCSQTQPGQRCSSMLPVIYHLSHRRALFFVGKWKYKHWMQKKKKRNKKKKSFC